MRLSVNIYILSSCVFNSVQGRAVSSTATVQVTVLDVNDNPPNFTKPLLTFGVASTADTGHVIVNLQVCLVWLKMFNAGLPPRSRVPGEIKRREVQLNPQVSPEEIMSREVDLGCESWTSFSSGCSSTAVQWRLSLSLCPERQLKQQLHSALVAAQWRGDTALTLLLFWRRSTVSPVFFGRYPLLSLHSFVLFLLHPPPPPPSVLVPNKPPRFCGCKAKWSIGCLRRGTGGDRDPRRGWKRETNGVTTRITPAIQ